MRNKAFTGEILLAAALAAILAAATGANEMSLKVSGGVVTPLGAHPSVRMVTARIEADIGPEDSKVTCQYVFQNEGPATMVTMGFPASLVERPSRSATETPALRDFRAWVDGRAVATTLKTGPDPRERWYVKEVTFAAQQRRVVRDSYVQPNGSSFPARRIFPYDLRGAGSWHGPVGRLDLVLRWVGEYDWGDPQVTHDGAGWVVSATGRQLKRSQLNAQPTSGLRLEFLPGWSDLRVDGYKLGTPGEGVVARAGLEYVQMTTRALGQALRAQVTYDPATKSTRIIGSHHKIVVTTGSDSAMIDGRPVHLPAAVRQESGRQWLAVAPLFEKLGYRALANHRYWRLELFSGQPPAWPGQVKGPSGKKTEAYLVSKGGVLLGEIRPLVTVIPGAEVSSPKPGAESHGSVRIILGRQQEGPHFEGGPAGSEGAPAHELWLTWGATEARLDGKSYPLTAAPYVNLLGHGMAPLAAVCKALGLKAAYSEESKTVTVSQGEGG